MKQTLELLGALKATVREHTYTQEQLLHTNTELLKLIQHLKGISMGSPPHNAPRPSGPGKDNLRLFRFTPKANSARHCRPMIKPHDTRWAHAKRYFTSLNRGGSPAPREDEPPLRTTARPVHRRKRYTSTGTGFKFSSLRRFHSVIKNTRDAGTMTERHVKPDDLLNAEVKMGRALKQIKTNKIYLKDLLFLYTTSTIHDNDDLHTPGNLRSKHSIARLLILLEAIRKRDGFLVLVDQTGTETKYLHPFELILSALAQLKIDSTSCSFAWSDMLIGISHMGFGFSLLMTDPKTGQLNSAGMTGALASSVVSSIGWALAEGTWLGRLKAALPTLQAFALALVSLSGMGDNSVLVRQFTVQLIMIFLVYGGASAIHFVGAQRQVKRYTSRHQTLEDKVKPLRFIRNYYLPADILALNKSKLTRRTKSAGNRRKRLWASDKRKLKYREETIKDIAFDNFPKFFYRAELPKLQEHLANEKARNTLEHMEAGPHRILPK